LGASKFVLTVFFTLIDVQDFWDSIKNNDYFSTEGAMDVFRQVGNAFLTSCTVDDLRDVKYIVLVVLRSGGNLEGKFSIEEN
jgi:hypothetical protein